MGGEGRSLGIVRGMRGERKEQPHGLWCHCPVFQEVWALPWRSRTPEPGSLWERELTWVSSKEEHGESQGPHNSECIDGRRECCPSPVHTGGSFFNKCKNSNMFFWRKTYWIPLKQYMNTHKARNNSNFWGLANAVSRTTGVNSFNPHDNGPDATFLLSPNWAYKANATCPAQRVRVEVDAGIQSVCTGDIYILSTCPLVHSCALNRKCVQNTDSWALLQSYCIWIFGGGP